MVQIPVVWDLISQFKHKCKQKGWWVSEYEDVINANGEYHNFLCVRKVHPKTFKRVISSHCAPIRDGASYRIVRISYMAWIFQERAPENLILIVAENSQISKNIALYDLSEAYAGKPVYLKLNETKSIVFREFESFLKTEYGLNFIKRLPPLPPEQAISEEASLNV